ncbi:MAG: aromatic acid exporter family protein [Sporomusaceae bacterium]|nr:aromatic acid exporter family protein [Sporomusaceae bacterium]
MNFIGYRTLKTVIGTGIAMYLAIHFDLKFATTAGIITILCIQGTRKQSVRFAAKMIGSFLLALCLSIVIFQLCGYTPFSFTFFLLIFIPLTVQCKVQDGIVVSSVLITHLLIEENTSLPLLINQMSLMGIGVLTAMLLNLYMPNFEHKIKKEQVAIEGMIQDILRHMAETLKNQPDSLKGEALFTALETKLKQGRELALKNYNNSFYTNSSDYTQYMDIRLQQLHHLKNMQKYFDRLLTPYPQTLLVADYTIKIAKDFHHKDIAVLRLDDFNRFRQSFTTMELPRDRDEFEHRGMLYQYLNDMEELLFLQTLLK